MKKRILAGILFPLFINLKIFVFQPHSYNLLYQINKHNSSIYRNNFIIYFKSSQHRTKRLYCVDLKSHASADTRLFIY